MTPKLHSLLNATPSRKPLPVLTYPGLPLIGQTVQRAVNDPQVQFDAQMAIQEKCPMPLLMSAMDLSVEAETFGCTIKSSDMEVPTVTGQLVRTMEEAEKLHNPQPGDGRTHVFLDTVRLLVKHGNGKPVIGGQLGPFSLAARLTGVAEALEHTLEEPEMMHVLLEKSTTLLTAYAKAFKEAGAIGLFMAEPAAGLLSPNALATFSSAYVKHLREAVEDSDFSIILHNCAARLTHLPAILQSGARTLHFGAPADLPAMLAATPPTTLILGNLDPSGIFCQKTPEEVAQATQQLLDSTQAWEHFHPSSGCDLPAQTPLRNIESFFHTIQQHRR